MKIRYLIGICFLLCAAVAQAQDSGVAARATEILKDPSADSAVVGRLQEAAAVKVHARQGGWMRIESANGNGWVRLLAIRTTTGSAPSTQARGGFLSFLSRPSTGGGQTVTTGVRGLDKEQIQNARPNTAELQSYVNALGRWISLHSERPDLPWQFGVLESDNINAFATPGGFILVTKGLVARMKSEAELAGVLGHEITHVIQKHHLKAIQKGAGLQAGANILSEFTAKGRNQAVADRLVGGIKELMLRGLDKEQIQNARPNTAELQKMAGFAASKPEAERFGASAGLSRQQIGYLKPPAASAGQ